MSKRLLACTIYSESDAAVVSVLHTQFRSFQPRRISRLRDNIIQVARRCKTRRVILSLSQVACYGASFLGMLVDLFKRLRQLGRQLIVCSDRLELIKLCRLDALLPSLPTVADALNWQGA